MEINPWYQNRMVLKEAEKKYSEVERMY